VAFRNFHAILSNISSWPRPTLAAGRPVEAPPRPRLVVTLFGATSIADGNGADITPRGRKARAVLAILALAAPRPVLRDRLAALLWSSRDRDQARASLRQCLHEIQALLAPIDPTPLHADLDGIDPVFDAWLREERLRFGRAGIAFAERALLQGADPPVAAAAAIAAAEQHLSLDPASEPAWRVLIASHLARGDRAAAAQALRQCTASLAEHLRQPPAPETEALLGAPPPGLAVPVLRRTRGARLGVRPFRSIDGAGPDPLALGLAEEITTALARFRWFFLVASPTLASIEGDPSPANPRWRSLALDFLLDGTIQHAGGTVRVSVRLIDLHAGPELLWADRFDRDAGDLLSLQDDIAAATAAQIDPAILLREGQRAARQTQHPSAYSLTMAAVPAIYQLEETSFRAAGEALAEAIRLDPGYASAHAWLACWHIFELGQNWAADPARSMARAAGLAERAVALDPSDARAVTIAGHVQAFLHHRISTALQLHERALALNPNLPLAWALSALAHCYAGHHDEALSRVDHARHLSPYDPHAFFFDMAEMLARLMRGDYAAVIELGHRALTLNPAFTSSHKIMLSALGHLGRPAETAELCARLLALEPGFTVTGSAARTPLQRPTDLARYEQGLLKAGLPA
jgi:DNA-binding SARP family transcriptional activator/TolB-like protein